MAPERDPQAVAESSLVNESAPDLLMDGAERRRQRPKDAHKQVEHYSGKKHDKKIADENGIAYPVGATLGKDTGFQGYEPKGVLTLQPKKAQGQRVERSRSLSERDHLRRSCLG